MGGPHVTEMADEALGRDGGSRHAERLLLAKLMRHGPELWKMPCAARSRMSTCQWTTLAKSANHRWQSYPEIPWDKIKTGPIQLAPGHIASTAQCEWALVGEPFELFPVESGRGCPYGASFAP